MFHLLMLRSDGQNAQRPRPAIWRWGLAIGALVLTLIGCNTASDKEISAEATITPWGVLFPQQMRVPDPQTYPAALLQGKLVVVERCMRVIAIDDGTSYMLVWPPDFSLSTDRGILIVLNGAGQALYRQDDTISIGGGEVPPDGASWSNIPLLRQKPPKECPGPYWLVSPLALLTMPTPTK